MDRKKEIVRLKKKVGKWLAWWVGEQYFKSSLEESRVDLSLYSEGKKDDFSSVDIQTILFWHLVHYEEAVVSGTSGGSRHLALAVRYAEAYVGIKEADANEGKNGSVLQTNAVLYLSLAVLAGWKEVAGRIGKALVQGLDTSLLDLRHTDRHCAGEVYRHFWFLLHLYEKISGNCFDIKNYSYPPDMSPYAAVLDDWQTSDLTKVHDWVCVLADFHIQQTRNSSHDEIEEFDVEDTMIFPFEILCWLRLREWAGLANPESFDHPLMQLPLARLPTPVPLAMPIEPLLDKVIARFRREYPKSFA